MQIGITLGGERVHVDRDVFVALLDNSVANGRAPYRHAMERGEIPYSALLELAEAGKIPCALFFAPLPVVQAQLEIKTAKLLGGLTKRSFSLNARNAVALSDIELILKDLLRKQELLKKHDPTLAKNKIVGSLSKPGFSVEADAAYLAELLGLEANAIRGAATKGAALEALILRLESNQVLVSQSQNNYMPQRLAGVRFSGMTVKDTKVPYIFLPSGDEGEEVSPAGRRTFTLTLLAVLIARGIFAPVNYDSTAEEITSEYEYDLTAQILMPAGDFKAIRPRKRADFEGLADEYKVTPSAVIVRALRLGRIDRASATAFLGELEAEFRSAPKQQGRTSKPVNGVRKYNGRELSWRMVRALDEGRLSTGDFCREVCLNNLTPGDLEEFRRSLR